MNERIECVKSVLANGLRVLTAPMPAARSVTVMVMAGTGREALRAKTLF